MNAVRLEARRGIGPRVGAVDRIDVAIACARAPDEAGLRVVALRVERVGAGRGAGQQPQLQPARGQRQHPEADAVPLWQRTEAPAAARVPAVVCATARALDVGESGDTIVQSILGVSELGLRPGSDPGPTLV